ncbi:MAG TPA: SPFH domain-containing protein [Chloroflexota bacterium]|nr:SPFH domain-containing protein [Chloroflexota bacterium]
MNVFLGFVVIGAVLTLLVIMWVVGTLFRRVGPNRALIVYGWGGTHIVTGGGKVVWPLFQSFQELSLELMSFDVAPEQQLYTSQGVAVSVEAVAQIKVKSDPESIRTSAEQFLTKHPEERQSLLRLVMEGHLRGIVGLLKVEEIVKEPEIVAGRVRDSVSDDLNKMGLEVVSFTIKKVIDENDYINNMGRPDIARVKREADIAQAEAERDTAIRRAMAMREAAVAQAAADQERVIAQTASEAKQAEANRDLEVKRADYEASVRQQRALAEKAYDIAANQAQQKVVAELVRIDQVQRQEQIKVQELEVARRERELEATVTKSAEAERRKIELLAEAQRQKLATEAAGQAEATRLQGTAEAEIVRAKGQAEADAMHMRAGAYQEYNQAAVLDKLLSGMPEVVRALSQSLAAVDKITVVSTGDGRSGAGVSQLTGEVTKMVAQVPELFETLTGMKMGDLMDRLQGIESRPLARPKDNGSAGSSPSTSPSSLSSPSSSSSSSSPPRGSS